MTFAEGLGSRGTSKDKTSLSNPTQRSSSHLPISRIRCNTGFAPAPHKMARELCAILTFNRHSEWRSRPRP